MPKITKKIHRCSFLDFIKENLPRSLTVHTHCEGYAPDIDYIEQRMTGISFGVCTRNKVAQVGWSDGGHMLDVLDPQWYSDLEDLAVKYEKYSKERVELVLHEYVPCKEYGE